jgi:hypothetical protein
MTIDRRLLAGALGCALLVAACGSSSATASPSAASSSAAAQSAAPSVVASTDASSQQPSSEQPSGPDISLAPGAASDLEAMLPTEVNGVKFTRNSFDGASIPASGTPVDSSKLDPVLSKYGKSIADVRFALATPTDTTSSQTAMVLALQVKGVPATEWMSAAGTDTSSMTKATVSGKQVLQEGAGGFSVIVYTKGDILFEVLLASDDLAKAIVAGLP